MTVREGLRATLVRGAAELGLALSDTDVDRLLDYLDQLAKWSRVYNLTSVRDPAEMLTHHVLDSLAVIGPLRRFTQGAPVRLLDVGSGGGLPGALIAICCPDLEVTCVDAVAKKTSFVRHVAGALAVDNLTSVHARVELVAERFDVVVSRAFASLGEFVALTQKNLADGGAWVAMKGRYPEAELAAVGPGVAVFHVEQLKVPGLDAERCLVWLRPDNMIAP